MNAGTIIITRPQAQCETLGAELPDIHWLAAPVFCVVARPPSDALDEALAYSDIVITTSANALPLLPPMTHNKPLWVVGASSATKARELGFTNVHEGGGTASALAEALKRGLKPGTHALYARGKEIAFDLAGTLKAHGIACAEHIVYSTLPVNDLPEPTLRAMTTGQVAGITFFSQGALQHFVDRALKHISQEQLFNITALCFSESIGLAAHKAGFTQVRVASSPQQQAMLDCIQAHCAKKVENHQHSCFNSPMTEEQIPEPRTEDTTQAFKPAPSSRDVKTPIRKILFAVGFVLISWLLFVQVIPRLAGIYAPSSSITPSPVAPTDTAIAEASRLEEETLLGGSDARQEVARLRAELDDLRVRLAVLEEKSVSAALPQALEERLSALESRPAESSTSQPVVDPALVARLESTERELAQLQEVSRTAQSAEWRKVGMLTASQQLEARASSGRPFAAELESLRSFTAGNPLLSNILDSLAPVAIAGIVSQNALEKNFELAARTALSAGGESDSIGDKLKHSLSKIVTVRKTGEQPGNSDEAIIARAETAVKSGNLVRASRELQSLSPTAAAAFEPWLSEVADILLVRTQLDELHNAILKEIRASEPQTPGTP